MDAHLATFASELVKIAAEREKKRQGYLGAVAAAAPYAIATGAADVPKGALDQYVQNVVKGTKGKVWKTGPARGVSRMGAGLVTSPVFLSGIKDLKSDDPERRKKGYAKIVGSGALFGALKGGGEAILTSDKGKKNVLKAVKDVAGARGLMAMGAGALTARSIAKATKSPGKGKKKEEKKSLWKQYGAPAAVGAGTGLYEGAFEEAYKHRKNLKGITRRNVAGGALGRAAAGALGAAVMTHAVKKLMPKKNKRLAPSKKNPRVRRWQTDKTASSMAYRVAQKALVNSMVDPGVLAGRSEEEEPYLGPGPSEIYPRTRAWAKQSDEVDIVKFYNQIVAEGMGERTPSRRAAHYALYDELTARGHELPTPKMRERVSSRPSDADTATLGGLMVAASITPHIVSDAVRSLPESDQDAVLSEALDRLFIQNKIHRVDIGEGEGPAAHVYWEPGRKKAVRKVFLAKNEKPGIVAHELGHANMGKVRSAMGGMFGGSIGDTGISPRSVATATSIILPLLAVDSARDSAYATEEELKSKARMMSTLGVVAGTLQAPLLAEETLANIHGYRFLRQAGASSGTALAKMITQAGPGYATYAVPVALPFIAARHIRGKAEKRGKR